MGIYLIFSIFGTFVLGFLKMLSIIPFARMAADDFSYTLSTIGANFFKVQYAWYMSWTGKYTSTLIHTIFGPISASMGEKTYLYLIITFSLLFVAILFFVKSLLRAKKINLSLIAVTGVLFVAYYFITPDKNESWYWLSGSATYLWPTIFAFFAGAVILAQKYIWWTYLLLFVSVFLVGGGNEGISLLNFVTWGVLVGVTQVINFLKEKKKKSVNVIKNFFNFSSPKARMLLFAFAVSTISLFVVYLCPGNQVRLSAPGSDRMNLFGSFAYAIQNGPGLVLDIIRNNIVFLTPLFICVTWLFSKMGRGNFQKSNVENQLAKLMFTITSPLVAGIIVMFPGYLSLGRIPPTRVYVTLAFVIILAIVFSSHLLSRLIDISKPMIKIIVLASSLILIISTFGKVNKFGEDIYTAKNYAQVYDELVSNLKNGFLAKQGEIIIVPTMPDSGLVHKIQLSDNPKDWLNQTLKSYYKFEVDIYMPKADTQ